MKHWRDSTIPKFSVIIPLYNKEPHIARALDSVISQTVQDFEIIVVDDGSTDKSAEIVRTFNDSRIRLIQQENAGVSAARNKGILESKAPLIALLDADDEWTPAFLEEILKLSIRFPLAGIYSTAYCIIDPNGKKRSAIYKAIPPAPWKGILPSYFLTATLGDSPICSSSVCIPRNIFSEIGLFKIGSWWGEDDDLWGRIATKYPVAFSWEIGAINYRDAVNRACNKSKIIEVHPFVITGLELLRTNQVPKEITQDFKEYIARCQLIVATHNIYLGNRKVAKKILKECITERQASKKRFWYFLALVPSFVFDMVLTIKNIFLKLFHLSFNK